MDIDDDGFIHILGRVKRFAKIAGEMISLEVVEKIAVAASPGFQHAASSRPDERRGEAIVLFTTDPSLTRERLQQAAHVAGLVGDCRAEANPQRAGNPAAGNGEGQLCQAEGRCESCTRGLLLAHTSDRKQCASASAMTQQAPDFSKLLECLADRLPAFRQALLEQAGADLERVELAAGEGIAAQGREGDTRCTSSLPECCAPPPSRTTAAN